MPKFYQLPENWSERGHSTITARPWYRRFKLINNLLPYSVGDRVRFHVHFEKLNEDAGGWKSNLLFETFGDKTKQICAVNGIDTEVVGSTIDRQGDISYSIGYTMDSLNALPIFTATVESTDSKLSKWWWIIIGAVFSFLCACLVSVLAWLLGFVEIIPKWQMFLE